MKKRPLCFVCLIFLIIRSIMLAMTGGRALVELPAASIFQEIQEDREIQIQGQVYKKSNTSKVQILYLKNTSFYKSKILIYDETFQEVALGKTVKVSGVFTPFEEARNPGNFDQKLYYAKQNIYGSVWSNQIQDVTGEIFTLREELYQIKKTWKQNIFETIGEKNGAILSAMLLGEKGEMDAEMKELYQKNGIGHILAISGLHISFIGLGIYKIIRKIGCPYWLSGVISVMLLSLYALMIGFSVSVLRAYIMLLLRIGADMTGRVYDMATSLFLAGAITILYQPLYLLDAGFLLSYGAIMGILFVLPLIEMLFPCRYKFLSGFYAGLSINIMLFPILLFFYFEFPVYSFLLNMAVIPLMSVVLGLGIFGLGSFWLWRPLGVWMLKGCGGLLDCFEFLSRLGSRLPGSRVVFGQPEVWQVVIYYAALCGMIFWFYQYRRISKESSRYEKKMGIRRMRRCCCMVCCVTVSLFLLGHGKFAWIIGQEKIAVTVIDVGQGDGIFLRGPNCGTYLIDGGSSDVTEVGKYRLEPFLKSQGVGKLDFVFLSHGDLDHISGIQELVLRQNVGVKIRHLVLPVSFKEDDALYKLAVCAKKKGIDILVMESGQILSEGEMTVRCIQPCRAGGKLEGNAGSMVLDVTFGAFNMLCTGDVEAEGEELLIKNLSGRKYDVLKVAHHGSKNSTSEEFLKRIKPKIAVVSSGKENRYGHPHKETIERLRKSESEIYSTVKSGAIQIFSDGKTVHVNGYR